jgi:hypothetical protein
VPDALYKTAFQLFDTNGNGVVHFGELIVGYMYFAVMNWYKLIVCELLCSTHCATFKI